MEYIFWVNVNKVYKVNFKVSVNKVDGKASLKFISLETVAATVHNTNGERAVTSSPSLVCQIIPPPPLSGVCIVGSILQLTQKSLIMKSFR